MTMTPLTRLCMALIGAAEAARVHAPEPDEARPVNQPYCRREDVPSTPACTVTATAVGDEVRYDLPG